MAIILASGPLSLTEIIEAIRIQSRDETSTPVFEDDDIKLALRQAVLNSHGKYFTTHTTTLAYVGGTDSYTIDDSIQRVILVTRERSSLEIVNNTLSGVSFPEDIVSFRHINQGKGSNKLYFFRDYLTSTMNIYYERDIPIPLDNRVLGAAISTTTATSATLTDAEPHLWRLSLPAYFKIDNEIIKVTAISANTTLTIARGQLGSTAATHTNGTTISQVLMADSDNFYSFLFNEIGRLLNMWRVQAGSTNTDVSANLTATRLFGDEVRDIKMDHAQPRRTRKMKFLKTRRPRRRY